MIIRGATLIHKKYLVPLWDTNIPLATNVCASRHGILSLYIKPLTMPSTAHLAIRFSNPVLSSGITW